MQTVSCEPVGICVTTETAGLIKAWKVMFYRVESEECGWGGGRRGQGAYRAGIWLVCMCVCVGEVGVLLTKCVSAVPQMQLGGGF